MLISVSLSVLGKIDELIDFYLIQVAILFSGRSLEICFMFLTFNFLKLATYSFTK